MRQHRTAHADADPNDLKKLLRQIRTDGALSIRDIDTDELVEKNHPWGSRKPSKRMLEYGFYSGKLTISERNGMVKSYELMARHFGTPPKPATSRQIDAYLLDRALTSQGLISGASVMHPKLRFTPDLTKQIETRLRKKALVPVRIADDATLHYATPEALETPAPDGPPLVHILSPFDPLAIQRRRTSLFFGYDHVFEAYVPKAKRKFGYFTLPVLAGDEIVAALDLKTDRAAGKLLIQAWHWVGKGNDAEHKAMIEEELGRFERFQLGN